MTVLVSGDRTAPWALLLPVSRALKPLKYEVAINRQVLPETTPPNTPISYIDISTVDGDGNIGSPEQVTFETAPSRARRLPSPGDTIVSTVRTYLRAIAFLDSVEPGTVCSTGFAVVTPGPRLDPEFLSYWLRSDLLVDEICARSVGVSYPGINASEIGNLPVPLLPLGVQRAIAAFLDRKTASIDALIAKKERLIELLQEKRQALITQAVTKGLDPNVPAKDSGVEWLGEIPTHWRVQPIKHLVASRKGAIRTGPFGSQLTASDMSGGSIKVYNQRTVLDRDFEAGDLWISDEKFGELRSFEVFPGDLLITSRGTIGATAIAPRTLSRGILHPCLIRMQVERTRTTAEYLSLLLDSHQGVRDQLALRSNATTISVIYSDDLRQVVVPVPPLDEQEKILSEVQRVLDLFSPLVIAAQRNVGMFREYRQALISAAVTGKIQIPAEEAA